MAATSLPAARHLARLVGTSDSRKALRVGAQIYINFMSLTRRSGWLQGHISKQAARDPIKADSARRALLTAAERHLTFVDLFSGKGALRRDVPRAVPTRDVSVVWCADLLRPQSSIAGRLEDPNLHHRGAPYSPSTLEQRPFCLRGDDVVG